MRRGVTLVELLVAIVISGIVAFMVFEMFRGETSNYSQTKSRIRLQTEAREAVRIIEEELNNAGYRMGATVTSGKLSVSDCNNGYTGLNGFATQSFVKPVTNGIEYIVYNPFDASGVFDCNDDLQRIRYTWDPTDSILYRRWVKGKSADIDKVDPVPFLEHVASFTIDYGVYRDGATLLTETQSGAATVTASGLTVAKTNAGSTWTFTSTGWSTGTAGFILNPGDGFLLDTNSTYRISFQSFANTDFLDGTTGIDRTSLQAGFFSSTGGVTDNVFRFCPGASSGAGDARTIQFDLNPSANGIENKVYFGVTGKLLATSPGAPSMSITGLTISRLNRGRVEDWKPGSDATQDWSKIGVVRITLSVRGKRNTVVTHQRNVVLINNDPRI